jgi:hypothetical protein
MPMYGFAGRGWLCWESKTILSSTVLQAIWVQAATPAHRWLRAIAFRSIS